MKALEASQAAALRQMEDEDLLADLRQRNARLERGDVDMDEVLRARHAERVGVEEEKRKREAEEDEEVVKRYFYKVKAAPAANATPDEEGKGQGLGLGDGYASDDEQETDDPKPDQPQATRTVTVKRSAITDGKSTEPTVQELLAAKGIELASKPAAVKPKPSLTGIKRKEGGVLGLGVKLKKKKQ